MIENYVQDGLMVLTTKTLSTQQRREVETIL